MPRLGAVPWRFSGAFPATRFLSRGPNANAPAAAWEHQEGRDALKKGEFHWGPGSIFFQSRSLGPLSFRDSHNPSNEFSTLTGHRGHCLLTQPGQQPWHLQKGVHTFCYLHMSVSNFLKNKSNLNLVKWGRNLFFLICTNGLLKIDAMNSNSN